MGCVLWISAFMKRCHQFYPKKNNRPPKEERSHQNKQINKFEGISIENLICSKFNV